MNGQPGETPPAIAPRDAGNWAKPVERLTVNDVRQGALNLNVHGRATASPLKGFGQLWQKTYQIRLSSPQATPHEVVRAWKAHFPDFQPPANRFFPSVAGVKPGEVVLINAMTPGGPVSTGVMVMYSDDESFTLLTPQGHPESGWVTFSAFEQDGETVAQVQSLARANDPIYEVAFRLIGSAMQENIWRHVLVALAAHFGVTSKVEMNKTCLDTRLQWSQAGNVRHNAQIHTLLHTIAWPVRRLLRRKANESPSTRTK
jgi:hypothetical protein